MLALRPAMNAPVLNVNFLPVGPARAAIVAFAEEYGGIGMALGIRTNEGGHVVVIRNQESLDFDTPIAEALEPLLAEAERMGFLFDEDMVAIMPGDKGRAHAMGLWARLMGEVEMPPAPRAVPPQPAANEPVLELSDARVLVDNPSNIEIPELDLDDLADFDDDEIDVADDILELDLSMDDALPPPAASPVRRSGNSKPAAPVTPESVAPTRERPAASQQNAASAPANAPLAASAGEPGPAPESMEPTQAPEQTLSKFRNAEQMAAQAAALPRPTPAPPEGEGGNELGRIPLVRVRRERDGSKRVPYLARLLSSF
jgi:hypothetical protein